MTVEVRLPRLSSTAETATVVRWHKSPGQRVEAGEVLVEIETDKATMEVESPESGVVVEILVPEGESAPVGAVIARLAAGEQAAASQPPAAVEGTGPQPAPAAGQPVQHPLAQEPAPTPAFPGQAEAQPLSPMRRRIAEVVRASWSEIPSFWVEGWVAASGLLAELERLNSGPQGQPVRLTVTDFLLQALADVLEAHPAFRVRLVGSGPDSWARQPVQEVSLGLLVAVPPEGLIMAVLSNLSGRSLPQIARMRQQAVELARSGRVQWFDVQPTLSLSNLGAEGPDRFRAIVYPGQVGIVAVGRLHERAVVRNGAVVAERGFYVTLTVDHRLVDGVEAAQFLSALGRRIEQGPWNATPAS